MKKALILAVVLFTTLTLAGCVSVNKVVRERVDQETIGNRGYLQGSSSGEEMAAKARTREYMDVRVEIPTVRELKSAFSGKKGKKEAEKGNIESAPESYQEESYEESAEEYAPQEETASAGAVIYKVKEGDSLEKIAKQFYGKKSKWNLIYDANKAKIKNPNKIRPGIELVIPGAEEKSEYVK